MAAVILQPHNRRWACPSCNVTAVSREIVKPGEVVSKLHRCAGQKGLLVPFVEVVGVDLAKHSHVHRIVERGDWAGTEQGLMTDADGKVVMAVQTEREDGYDTHVFPAAAGLTTREPQ